MNNAILAANRVNAKQLAIAPLLVDARKDAAILDGELNRLLATPKSWLACGISRARYALPLSYASPQPRFVGFCY